MKTLFRFLTISIIGLLVFTYLSYGETGQLLNPAAYALPLLLTVTASYVAGIIIMWLSRVLNRSLPWKKYFTARFVVGMLVYAVVIGTIVSTFVFAFTFLERLPYSEFVAAHQDSAIKMGILFFFILFIYSITEFTFYSYNEYAIGQIETIKLEREQMELQFEALKTQLSPHYLFNCLNTISSLVDTNAEYAETFIRRLVQTYQYILDSKDKKLIPVADEIDFVKAYQFLLKVRFGDAMKINFDLRDDVMRTLIPPLTIQILIENAVKHNEISEDEPLEIDIKMDHGDFITVRNDKTKSEFEEVSSFKIGLENIQKRYQYFTSKPVKIIDQQNFEVKLPLIPAA